MHNVRTCNLLEIVYVTATTLIGLEQTGILYAGPVVVLGC